MAKLRTRMASVKKTTIEKLKAEGISQDKIADLLTFECLEIGRHEPQVSNIVEGLRELLDAEIEHMVKRVKPVKPEVFDNLVKGAEELFDAFAKGIFSNTSQDSIVKAKSKLPRISVAVVKATEDEDSVEFDMG